ncbi:efflux RND transporter permease subunit [Bauldia sp.]|uniref:efflux RND transporter permease subunit n=1 Tax=Bauldia sp. TaxID=2575872 RepID=UPI003BA9E904
METLTFRHPRIVALALLVIISAGLSSLLSIGRQEDPTITNLFASITTSFPGADPERVEALVTAEIEDALREIPEVDVIESASSTGISIVSIELIETLGEDRIEQVWSEVRDAIDDAARTFPDGVQEPEFDSDGAGAFAAIVALTAVHDRVPMTIAGRYADGLADELRNIPGTKLVETFGAPDEEVLVTIDPAAAAALGLTPDQVSAAIRAADSKVQAGRLRGADSDFVINVEGEITALDRLRRVVIRGADNGKITLLGDIAEVTRGARLPQAETARSDGRAAILVAAKINDGLQVDVWMANLRDTLADYQSVLPASLSADLVFDQSLYTADRLTEVGINMAIGVALVVAVLFITLGARAAAIVALVLPLVSLATLATMNAIGLPIHQMSVTGLIVALGLLVDAAIVMTDEVGKRIRAGESRIVAVQGSVRRLFAPLLASTATTALSFMPMILLPGPAGDFVGAIAIAVVLMLMWSFLVAVTITPAIAGWILPARQGRSPLSTGIRAGALGRVFEASLRWAVRNPIKSVMLALILPLIGFASFPTLTAQFFPGVDRDQFYIEVELADGTALAETEEVAIGVDQILRGIDDIRQVSWVTGRSAPAFYYNIVGNRDQAPAFAQALVTTASPAATERLVPEVQRRLDSLYPQARILVRGLVQGPPVNAPVELRFVGPDTAVLRDLGDRARGILAELDTVTIVRTSANGGAPKINVDVDEAKARLLGLDLGGVARQLEASLEGVTGGSLLEGTEQLPVRVRVGDTVRGDLAAIANLTILPPGASATSASGAFPGVPLSAISDIRVEPSESVITRRNAERANTVQAFLLQGILPEEALEAARAELDAQGFEIPSGYRLEFGGDSDARSSTLNNLLASVGLIVALSIAVVVLTFNSFRLSMVTFVVAGLSAGLSILSLAVFQYPFGINAVIGVIGSIGVSINAAIIILTGLQANPEAAAGDTDSMVDVVMGSSRHIISTTLTTFGGFLPLILAGGGFWPPFAMSVAGGVLLSTVVSFYFTPPMFALIYRKKRQEPTAMASDTPPPASEPTLRLAAE